MSGEEQAPGDGLFSPLSFTHGRAMKNRFMLAPLTNLQSHEDGVLSKEELHWLRMRARGGFGLTMTCAAHVQASGQGFPGQLGIWSDRHIDGLSRLAGEIRGAGSLAFVQLHHAGMRSPGDLIGTVPVCPSDNPKSGARALTHGEVKQLAEDFITAALRAQRCGFNGAEIHGAHGYVIGQFLSAEINRREDEYGGSLENRSRLLFEIVEGIRHCCGPDFTIAVRISPERFGMRLEEAVSLAQQLMAAGRIDILDLSLWDTFKQPEEAAHDSQSLLSFFTGLERGTVRLAVAGKIQSPEDALAALRAGADIVVLGRAAILHHDFPRRCRTETGFTPVTPPVSRDYLRHEGLSNTFIDYMATWKDFVAGERSTESTDS